MENHYNNTQSIFSPNSLSFSHKDKDISLAFCYKEKKGKNLYK